MRRERAAGHRAPLESSRVCVAQFGARIRHAHRAVRDAAEFALGAIQAEAGVQVRKHPLELRHAQRRLDRDDGAHGLEYVNHAFA